MAVLPEESENASGPSGNPAIFGLPAALLVVSAVASLLLWAVSTRGWAGPPDTSKHRAVIDTPHFHITYDTGEIFARKRGELFEVLYERFGGFFADAGFSLADAAGRRKVLLLASRKQFDDRMRGEAPHAVGASGVYSSKQRLIIFFKPEADYGADDREMSSLEQNVRRLRSQVAGLRGERLIVTYPDGRTRMMTKTELLAEITAEDRRLVELRTRTGAIVRRDDEGTAFHECAHQLSNELGLLPQGKATPLWLREGIAMFFEHGDPREPKSFNFDRLVEFRHVQRAGRLFSLERLLTDDSTLIGASSEVGYPQSWALTHFLFHAHMEQMKRYVAALKRRTRSGTISAETRLGDFREAFGTDLDAIEASWLTYIDNIG